MRFAKLSVWLSLFAFVGVGLNDEAAAADQTDFIVTIGTEHKLATSIAPGERMCFSIYNLQTGAAGTAHFRRTRAGGKKDLDHHTGYACFTSKLGVYVLYASAEVEDLRIVFHGPNTGWTPPLPSAGSQSGHMNLRAI